MSAFDGGSGNGGMDLGDAFIEAQGASSRPAGGNSTGPSGSRSGNANRQPAASAVRVDPYYAIVLKTFSGDDHRMAAETMVRALPQVAPQLAGSARVHTKDTGSMVIVGEYESNTDEQAQRDLHAVRGMQLNGTPLFARVMLVRIEQETPKAAIKPFDLRTVRQTHPNVDLIYTLDVAVWLDPQKWDDQGAADKIDVQAEAERFCSSLRAQGYEAYFNHDADQGVSIVTVGVFGSGAIVDPSVGLLRSDVLALVKKFSPRLVNGEPLYVAPDLLRTRGRVNPDDMVAVEPRLVEVPK